MSRTTKLGVLVVISCAGWIITSIPIIAAGAAHYLIFDAACLMMIGFVVNEEVLK